ncbi:hypothetical protein MBLNU457_5643t1 [Dothideomycetes sp. NU457]
MGREEQKEEREVLDSIFPEEITDVNETEYRVAIKLEPEDHEDDAEPPTILLQVQYPESYPDEAPRLDIQNPPNAAKYPHLDVQDDKARLLDSLTSTIEENLGMAMVFTLVTTLKDSAELLIAERKQAIQALKDVEAAQAEAEENRKFEGEKVTRESFTAWLTKFKKEAEEEARKKEAEREEELKRKRGPKEEKKLTGKQLWERGMAGNAADEDDEGEDVLEGMRQMRVAS